MLGLVDGTRKIARPAAIRNTVRLIASSTPAPCSQPGEPVRKPAASAKAPSASPGCTIPAISRGRARLAPASTGRIWISAPTMTCNMKPTVSKWVAASAAGVHREAKMASPSITANAPASTRNSGAVRKKRSGADSGGLWSKESSACIDAQQRMVTTKVPSACSSVCQVWPLCCRTR